MVGGVSLVLFLGGVGRCSDGGWVGGVNECVVMTGAGLGRGVGRLVGAVVPGVGLCVGGLGVAGRAGLVAEEKLPRESIIFSKVIVSSVICTSKARFCSSSQMDRWLLPLAMTM